MQIRRSIQVSGIVQGVGFRPHVYRLAHRYELSGYVRNTAAGVLIEVQGSQHAITQFIFSLKSEAPPLAQINSISTAELHCIEAGGFEIVSSDHGQHPSTLIAPDIATCADCLRELLDPADRRYGYPFLNCTNCGPRFTILKHIPYDRPNTSMAEFAMCAACQAEYEDPLNRRFHAQPNACWDCGPQLTLLDAEGKMIAGDPIQKTCEYLQAGRILAIKGLGGFHLSVDATNSSAVEELRKRKKRFEKPFAVMVPNTRCAEEFCTVDHNDRALLESPQRPIVLMHARNDSVLPKALAPRNPDLGIFLPYTPLQHLLVAPGQFPALVMTSANLSDEPICIDNCEAVKRLLGIADFFLVHNRDILLRCDDSVARSVHGHTAILRRSRGFVPIPIHLEKEVPPVLAVGGELKNAICLTKSRFAFPGQHIGDLENLAAYNFFQESITHLTNILEIQPQAIAYDLHPGYLSTQWALEQERTGIRAIAVQHHHAHIASCMVENHLSDPVIGIVLDGTGYGTDAQVWGGEIMIADFTGFQRAAHFEYVPMPGGAQAIREPWRMAVAHLIHAGNNCFHEGVQYLDAIPAKQIDVVRRMAEQQIRSPFTSSCGRLFDAVAALIGLRTEVSFEAQAAIELEACCEKATGDEAYLFSTKKGKYLEIGTSLLFEQILVDLQRGISQEMISRKFHNGLIASVANIAGQIAADAGIRQVCCSGGCFLNQYLASGLREQLVKQNLQVYTQALVPPGDGGLSLGQALIGVHAIRHI